MSEFMKKRSFEITDIEKNSSQYPGICMDTEGKVYVCWQEYKEGNDAIYAGWLKDGQIQDKTRISGEGEALRPVMIFAQGFVWYAWSECIDREWYILARRLKDGVYSPIITVEKGEALFYPKLFTSKDQLAVVYNRQGKGFSHGIICWLDPDGKLEKERVTQSDLAYRPECCQGGDGRLYLVYDCFRKGRYDAVVCVRTETGWSRETTVNKGAQWATHPVIARTEKGVSICFYGIGDQAVFSYWTTDAFMENGGLTVTDPRELSTNKNWYHDISTFSNSKGTVVFAYTWGKYNINVRYRRKGEDWSEPVVMSYDDTHCGVHPCVMVDEKDNVHLLWQFANKNGHMDRNACIVYNTMNIAEMSGYFDKVVETAVDNFVQPIPGGKSFDKRTGGEVEAWLKKNGYEGRKLVFGDIHGQSGISDGVGEIDQYYHYAREKADLDFTALTDHDCYPDWISQSEWEWMRTTNRLMNTDGELACMLAYEWTPNEYRYDFGHKNIYYRGDDGEIFRSCDEGGMTPYKLFESVKKYGAMAFPHHPAADWGLVSAATDWNFHDPQVQRLVEIFSRHADFEDFESTSKYTKNIKKMKNCSVQDALARKYRMGFTAGSDSHQLEHGIEGGIFAVFVPELTREHVFDAMYDRFTYATTGARILVSLKAGTAHMGQEIKVEEGQPVALDVSVMGTAGGKVELLKNNQVIAAEETDDGICDFSYRDSQWADDDYYYVRVRQKDDHMAWTSPIWVNRR